jgi:hypothetical protein
MSATSASQPSATQLIESIQRQLTDLETYQVDQLRQCTAKSMQNDLSAEMRRDMDGVRHKLSVSGKRGLNMELDTVALIDAGCAVIDNRSWKLLLMMRRTHVLGKCCRTVINVFKWDYPSQSRIQAYTTVTLTSCHSC